MALSPMMQQYLESKEEYKDCLLFYRVGDFYELFFEDAEIASRELELTLTGKNCGLEERAPMCGVPHHAADTYIARLVEKGYKVALAEQLEDPATAKGLVKRDVIRVFTPGTLDIEKEGSADNRFLASVVRGKEHSAVAYTDINTGEFFGVEIPASSRDDDLSAELTKYDPKEILIPASAAEQLDPLLKDAGLLARRNAVDDSFYAEKAASDILMNQFGVTSLLSLDLADRPELTAAFGSLLLYLFETQKEAPRQIKTLEVRHPNDTMLLDRATIRNLELLETQYDHKRIGSLLGVVDRTKTAMGGRLLKRFLKEPLKNADDINARLDAVEQLMNHPPLRAEIIRSLKEIYDFERLSARIAGGRANAKDMAALRQTLGALPSLREALNHYSDALLSAIRESIGNFEEVKALLERAVVEDPPYTITEGGIFREGYSEELDTLKESIKEAKDWISTLETTERERTGIKGLRVGYNKVFGYYIDISKSNLALVPPEYVRKQTLVNNERYITPEQKEKESLVLSAEAKINALETKLFRELRASLDPYLLPLQQASSAVALLDVLVSFAEVSQSHGYKKPVVDDSLELSIVNGRHPAVEQLIGEGLFVANSVTMNGEDRSLLLITGPNMSGKSTYMRQTAILVLMAQIGCFLPCDSAHIGVVDRVFTRIGASDNLSYGQSTFYIEMSELAGILRHATARSLILLDEIGRGTSTFDGMSIAWATAEYLQDPAHRTRTLFATHYHELTALADTHPSVHNLSVAVSEQGKDIVFLHRIIESPASKSYGIHVAKIAGVPEEIRKNAARKLRILESSPQHTLTSEQISLFAAFTEEEDPIDEEPIDRPKAEFASRLVAELGSVDLDRLTPFDALLKLREWKEELANTLNIENRGE